jgi:hypothetical protein
MGKPGTTVAAFLTLLLAGCGGPPTFDAAKARPCEFMSDKDLGTYGVVSLIDGRWVTLRARAGCMESFARRSFSKR